MDGVKIGKITINGLLKPPSDLNLEKYQNRVFNCL